MENVCKAPENLVNCPGLPDLVFNDLVSTNFNLKGDRS